MVVVACCAQLDAVVVSTVVTGSWTRVTFVGVRVVGVSAVALLRVAFAGARGIALGAAGAALDARPAAVDVHVRGHAAVRLTRARLRAIVAVRGTSLASLINVLIRESRST